MGDAPRVRLSILDQAISSGTNVLVALVIARSLGATALGAFTVAFVFFSLGSELARAFGAEVLSMRVHDGDQRRALAGSASTSLSVGLSVGVVCLGASLVVTGPAGPTLAVMAFSVPGAILQDSLRVAFVALGDPKRALRSDLVWLVAQAVTLTVALSRPEPSATGAIAAWGVAALAAALFALVDGRIALRWTLARHWLEDNRRYWSRTVGEAVLRAGLFNASLLLIAAVVGVDEMGGFRASQVVFGLASLAIMIAPVIGIPEASRVSDMQGRVRVGGLAGAACLAATAVTAVGMSITPDAVGRAILGENWSQAAELAWPAAAMFATASLSTAGFIVLRGAAAVNLTLRLRALWNPIIVLAAVAGAWSAGIAGAMIGIALARLGLAVSSWALIHQSSGDSTLRLDSALAPFALRRSGDG